MPKNASLPSLTPMKITVGNFDLRIYKVGSSVCVDVGLLAGSDFTLLASMVIRQFGPITMSRYSDTLVALEDQLTMAFARASRVVL
jgi:hypothetical protein